MIYSYITIIILCTLHVAAYHRHIALFPFHCHPAVEWVIANTVCSLLSCHSLITRHNSVKPLICFLSLLIASRSNVNSFSCPVVGKGFGPGFMAWITLGLPITLSPRVCRGTPCYLAARKTPMVPSFTLTIEATIESSDHCLYFLTFLEVLSRAGADQECSLPLFPARGGMARIVSC